MQRSLESDPLESTCVVFAWNHPGALLSHLFKEEPLEGSGRQRKSLRDSIYGAPSTAIDEGAGTSRTRELQ